MEPPQPGHLSDGHGDADTASGESQAQSNPDAPIDWAQARDIVITVIGGAVILFMVAWLLQHVIRIILIVALSAVVAFILAPLVERGQRLGLSRGAATAAVYAGLVLAAAVATFVIGGGLATQFGQLEQQVPIYAQDLQTRGLPALQSWFAARGIRADLTQLQSQAASALQSTGTQVLSESLSLLTGVTDVLVNAVLVLVISLYLVLDGERIRDGALGLVPDRRRPLFVFVENSLVRVLGGYIRGQLTMAAIIGLSSGAGCWLLGVRYPLVIGVLAFFFELIPMLGPVLAAIPALLVSLFQPFPLVLFVGGFFVVMQLIESNVLGPRITGHAVGLHPIVSILALLGGAEVAGLWGALFAVPVVGLTVVLGTAAVHQVRGLPAEEVIRPRKPWALPLPTLPRPARDETTIDVDP